LVTKRAAEWRVVTVSKCGIHCFNSYLIPFRNRAVIMRRRFLWLHGDLRGGNFWSATFSGILVPLILTFISYLLLPDLFARDSVNLEECI